MVATDQEQLAFTRSPDRYMGEHRHTLGDGGVQGDPQGTAWPSRQRNEFRIR